MRKYVTNLLTLRSLNKQPSKKDGQYESEKEGVIKIP